MKWVKVLLSWKKRGIGKRMFGGMVIKQEDEMIVC